MTDFTPETPDSVPEDLSALETARLLGVSKLHVIDLLEAGELDYHWVGSDLRFDPADVAAYKAGREPHDAESLVGV